jgi:outer membrane protein assembly factor BamD
MKKTLPLLLASLLVLFFTSGCVSKHNEYNKSAQYWYEQIIRSIAGANLELADDYYLSLQSEHPKSELLEGATLILAKAHEDSRENLLAEFYYDEYIKRFATQENMEYYQFKKVDAAFKHLKATNKNQRLIRDTILEADAFLELYPNSIYYEMVQTVRTKLQLTEYLLNETVASLYDRIDKPQAAQIYRDRNNQSWIASGDLQLPEKNIIDIIFD